MTKSITITITPDEAGNFVLSCDQWWHFNATAKWTRR